MIEHVRILENTTITDRPSGGFAAHVTDRAGIFKVEQIENGHAMVRIDAAKVGYIALTECEISGPPQRISPIHAEVSKHFAAAGSHGLAKMLDPSYEVPGTEEQAPRGFIARELERVRR